MSSTGVTSLSTTPAISPFSLEGRYVRLEPLRPEHASVLWEIAKDHLADLFQWIPYRLQSVEDFEKFNRQVLDEQARGLTVPFATVERPSNTGLGPSRLMCSEPADRKSEIG